MFGLTIMQEAALAMVCLRQDELPVDLTDAGLTKQLLTLRDQDMLTMQTDWGGELAFVQKLLVAGAEHYDRVRSARRHFVVISDEADELLDLLYGEVKSQKKAGQIISLTYREKRDEDYRELSRAGLIKVSWADNMPYCVDLTDDGWSYAEGWFLNKEDGVSINVNPIFNNTVNSSSSSNALSSAKSMTLGSTVQQILDLEIDPEIKDRIEAAVKELEQATKDGDKAGFLDKLEKIAGIAKNSAELIGVIGPFIASTASRLFA